MRCWPPRPCFSMIIGHGSVSYLWMVTKRSCSALCPPSCARRSRCPAARSPRARTRARRRTTRSGQRPHNGHIALARFPPDGTFGWQRVHPKVPLGGNAASPWTPATARQAVPLRTATGQTAEYPADHEKRELIPRCVNTALKCPREIRKLPATRLSLAREMVAWSRGEPVLKHNRNYLGARPYRGSQTERPQGHRPGGKAPARFASAAP